MNNKEFLKDGNKLYFKNNDTEEYDLEKGKVYDLKWDDYYERPEFFINGDLNMPPKVYETSKDIIFKKHVLKYLENNIDRNVGVLLSGEKGTGKSIMAKSLALASNLPIIIVDCRFPAVELVPFFKKLKHPTCVIFDEIEKSFNTTRMLEFLDGIEKMPGRFVLMTCNDVNQVDENFINRCSRVRYYRTYKLEDNIEFLPMLIDDFETKNKEKVMDFCKKNITFLSMDNIASFLTEVKLWEDVDVSLEEIIEFMNISHCEATDEEELEE